MTKQELKNKARKVLKDFIAKNWYIIRSMNSSARMRVIPDMWKEIKDADLEGKLREHGMTYKGFYNFALRKSRNTEDIFYDLRKKYGDFFRKG